jgi:tetraacyldisaccharide-1-P 4'-kinase
MAEEAARLDAKLCVTTQKDAVKVARLWQGGALRVLKVQMEMMSGEEALIRELRSAMRG